MVVENKTGSGTLVGTEAAAQAAPDGYPLRMGSVANIALNMGQYDRLSYDRLCDFEPVGLAVSYRYTLPDVVAYARAHPGKRTGAAAGSCSGQHLPAVALWHLAGVNLVHVPYRGAQAGPAWTCWAGAWTCSSTCPPPRAARLTVARSGRWPCPGGCARSASRAADLLLNEERR